MKIKLIQIPRYLTDPNSRPLFQYDHIPPIGIATLTGFLKENGINVEQDDLDIKTMYYNLSCNAPSKKIDLSLFNNKPLVNQFIKTGGDKELEDIGRKILKLTVTKGFDVIGLSFSTFDNISSTGLALVMGKLLKEKHDPTVIFGGSSIAWDKIHPLLSTPFIDYGIESNSDTAIGELNLLKFCEQIEKGKECKKSPGVTYLKAKKIIRNHTHYKKEEEYQFTRPCFDGLPLDLYKHRLSCKIGSKLHAKDILVLPYRFVRGCPNSCAFCCHSVNPNWAALDPERVVLDLEHLSKRYKTNYFFFLNTNINPKYQYADSFAKAVKDNKLDVYWVDCANFACMDKVLLRKLKEAGAVRLMFGLECVSDKILKYIGKNLNLKHASTVIKEANKLGILVGLALICGLPYEENDDANRTVKFLRKHKKYLTGCSSLTKFYMDGRFLKKPDLYKIKLLDEAYTISGNWTRGFNETYGSTWEEKIKKTNESYDKVYTVLKQIERASIYQLFFRAAHPEIKEVSEIKDELLKEEKGINI